MDKLAALKSLIEKSPFDGAEICSLGTPLSIGFYQDWLAKGRHADMEWLQDHLEKKKYPEQLLKKARSSIVVRRSYAEHPWQQEGFPLKSVKIAKYAQGEDYHFRLREELQELITQLKTDFPNEEFLPMTDSFPVLERDLAYRAGLGWFGKNSCLISRDIGSYFFIGEIYTTIPLESPQHSPQHDFCGQCDRCITACPTGALVSPKELDAGKCISYWTIESNRIPDESLRSEFQGWLFGCDICQEVCPWNLKLGIPAQETDKDKVLADELTWILTSSNKAIQKALKTTALSRASGKKLKRNAIIVIANLKLNKLKSLVQPYTEDPWLGDLAKWCLTKLN